MSLDEVFAVHGGFATTDQLLEIMCYRTVARRLAAGTIVRVWHGVYAPRSPDAIGRLCALDLVAKEPVVACMTTAAQLYGFDTGMDDRIHVLDPGVRMRPSKLLMVHQRTGAPLTRVSGRLATSPEWTAVEVARQLRRPRALATLDAALRSGTCTVGELESVICEQKGRRGIVAVRELLSHADPRAESPMESEARLVFIDGGLPVPELQYEIVDRDGRLWRVDFAWPDAHLVAEYDSMQWHATPEALKHDRMKTARLQDCGWTCMPLVVEDVRRYPLDLVARVARHLGPMALAS